VGRRTTFRLGLLAGVIVAAVAGAALLTSRAAPRSTEVPAAPAIGTASAPGTAGASGTAEASGTAIAPGTAEAPTAEATGVVVAVESGGGLGDVRGFTLRVAGGELLIFNLRALENAAEFPPGHLVQHQADSFPVRVLYRTEGSERLAIRLEDAPP